MLCCGERGDGVEGRLEPWPVAELAGCAFGGVWFGGRMQVEVHVQLLPRAVPLQPPNQKRIKIHRATRQRANAAQTQPWQQRRMALGRIAPSTAFPAGQIATGPMAREPHRIRYAEAHRPTPPPRLAIHNSTAVRRHCSHISSRSKSHLSVYVYLKRAYSE